ncbi:zinc finger, CCHC-type containing protein [Tanacetum coccineum]
MKSRDVSFWKEAINDEMDSIMENNTWNLSDLPPCCKPLDCKWIFIKKMKVEGTIDKLLVSLAATYNLVIHQMDVKTTFLNGDLEEEVYMKQPEGFNMPRNEHKADQVQVDKTKEFLSLNFSMKDMREANVILGIRTKRKDKVSTPLDPTIKRMPNTGRDVDQLEYSRVIGYLMYAITSTRPDIAYVVEDHTSTSGWVFLLGRGAISWAFKKQTCITNSTMEAEFVALAGAGKEAKWLRNLKYEILLWPKPISPIFIHCDSAATVAKAYCQIYNGKSRHLGVRHIMWENDDYICHGHILNGMSDAFFDVYQNVGSTKELWDQLDSKYMREDASSKKFLVSNFNNYKMVYSRSVMEQYHELLRIIRQFTQYGLNMDESISVSSVIDKLPLSWKDFKHTLKHNKDELSLGATCHACKDRCWFETFHPVQDGSVLHIGDESTKPILGRENVVLEFSSGKTITLVNVLYVPELRKNLMSGPVLNKCGYKQVYESDNSKDVDSSMWHARLGHVHYKRMLAISKDNLIPEFNITLEKWNKKDVVTSIDDASRFCYVYLCHAKDEALDKFKIYKTEVELQQNDLIKTLRTNRGGEYYEPVYLHLIGIIHETTAPYTPQQNAEGSRDEIGTQYFYCYGIKEDPRTFDEAMKSHDVTFWKEAINDEMDSIMENNTQILSDLPPSTYNPVIHQMDVKTTFLNGDLEVKADQVQVDKTKEFLLSNFFMKDMGEANVIFGIRTKRKEKVSTPLDPTIKLMPNTGRAVDQLEYSRVIGCLMYAMTSTRPNIAYVVVLEGYFDASWITNSEDHTSTSEFVALAAAGKEARNLLYEIPLWPKPISTISIHCDSAAIVAKAYCQIYNEKSRHLGVRHIMVRGLITNGVIFVDFVGSQQNVADHLAKGLVRDLVHKSAIGMGLKSIKISNNETPNSLLANTRS